MIRSVSGEVPFLLAKKLGTHRVVNYKGSRAHKSLSYSGNRKETVMLGSGSDDTEEVAGAGSCMAYRTR